MGNGSRTITGNQLSIMSPNQPSQPEIRNPAFGEDRFDLGMPAVSNAITSEGGALGAIALPEDFPESLPPFSFKLGDRVRWKPMPSTDWGTIAGMEYAIHPLRNSWQPRYKVHLDLDSPSKAWIDSDWAWEWDLEPEPEQENSHSTRC